jgi:hypothetical protein
LRRTAQYPRQQAAEQPPAAVDTWTAPAEEVGYDPMKNYYRAGIKAGQYTAGSVALTLNGYDIWPPRF